MNYVQTGVTRVGWRGAKHSFSSFKPINEFQGYFSSPTCPSPWVHPVNNGTVECEGKWHEAMSLEHVPAMAKGPFSYVSICSAVLYQVPTCSKPLRILQFMVKKDVQQRKILPLLQFGSSSSRSHGVGCCLLPSGGLMKLKDVVEMLDRPSPS